MSAKLAAAKRRQRAMAMQAYRLRHIEGRQVGQVAAILGCSTSYAIKLARDGAQYMVAEELKDEARSNALTELDALREEAYRYFRGRYVVTQFGKIVLDDEGRPVQDIGPNLAALDRILKLEKRRAEIFGYDAPRRSTVNVVTEDAIMAEINRLEAEMSEAERRQLAATLLELEAAEVEAAEVEP